MGTREPPRIVAKAALVKQRRPCCDSVASHVPSLDASLGEGATLPELDLETRPEKRSISRRLGGANDLARRFDSIMLSLTEGLASH